MTDAQPIDDPLAAPASGEMEFDAPQSKWPTVIGIISLIYAVGGMLCMLGYSVSTFFSEALMRMGGMNVQLPVVLKITAVTLATLAIGVGIVMLMGAIGLLRRRRSGVKLLKLWAILRVALLLIGLVATMLTAPAAIQFQRSIIEAQDTMLRDAGREELPMPTDQEAWRGTMINTAIVTALFAAYPVFIMVWMTRGRIVAETEQWPT